MTPTNKDIKVLGRVVSVAVDSIVVDASLVKDSTLNEFQDKINKRVRDKLDSFDHEIVIDGRSQGDETRINENGISTFSLSATLGEFDTLTVDDQISADNILINRYGEIDGDFSVSGELTVYTGQENDKRIKLSKNGIFVDHESSDGAVKIDNEGITVYPIGAYDNVKISDGKISIDSSYIDKEVIRLQSEEGSYINLNSTGSIMIADRLPSSVGRSETAITPFDVTTKKIVANSYIPVAQPVGGGGEFDPSEFNEPGRYYFLVQNTLGSGSPCKYGVFVDVLCQYDNDDGSLIGIHQTYTMPSGANTPGDTTAGNLASEVYYTWDGSTWTTSVYPAGKTSFIA